MGPGDAGKVDAALSANVGVQVGAYTPLDLWAGAGLIARLRAQAALAGTVGLSVKMPQGLLDDAMRKLLPVELATLAEILLDHFTLRAGAWAHVALAAEVVAEATLAGTFNSSVDGSAGFTATMRYLAGFGFGAGYQVLANCTVDRPDQMVARVADVVTAVLTRGLRADGTAASTSTQEAAALLKVLLPLGFRTAYRLIADLAAPASSAVGVAGHSAGTQFVRQAQRIVLEQVVDMAASRLGKALSTDVLSAMLGGTAGADAAAAYAALKEAVGELAKADESRAVDVINGVLDVAENLAALLACPTLPVRVSESTHDLLTCLWAAATLAGEIVHVLDVDGSAPADADVFAGVPRRPPPPSVAALVRADGAPPALTDLVTFLARANLVPKLTQEIPGAGAVLDWLQTTLGTDVTNLVGVLLSDLAAPSPAHTDALIASLRTTLSGLVKTKVLPLLDDLTRRPPFIGALGKAAVEDLAKPGLAVLPDILLPALTGLDSDEAVLRLREAMSAVLLQMVSHFLVTGITAAASAAAQTADQALASVEADLKNLQGNSRSWQSVALGLGSLAATGFILPQDVIDLLDVVRQLIGDVEADVTTLLAVCDTALQLGLASGTTLPTTLSSLKDSASAVVPADLSAAAGKAVAAAGKTAFTVLTAVPILLLKHIEAEAVLVEHVAAEVAQAVVTAVTTVVDGLSRVIDALHQQLEHWAQELEAALAQLTAGVAAFLNHVETLVNHVIDQIRAEAHRAVHTVVGWLGPGVEQFCDDLVDGLLDALDWLADHVLGVLSAGAQALSTALQAATQDGNITEATLHAAVQDAIRRASTTALHFDLRMEVAGAAIPLGSVTIESGVVAGIAHGAVTADPTYQNTVSTQVPEAQQVHIARANRDNVQATYDKAVANAADLDAFIAGQQAAATQATAPSTPAVLIEAPGSATTVTDGLTCPIRIRLSGGNPTLVQGALGLSPRVVIEVNGNAVTYSAADWTNDGADLVLSATLVGQPQEQIVRAAPADAAVHAPVAVGVATGIVPAYDGSTDTMSLASPHDPAAVRATLQSPVAPAARSPRTQELAINAPGRLAIRLARATEMAASVPFTEVIKDQWPTVNHLTTQCPASGDISFSGTSRGDERLVQQHAQPGRAGMKRRLSLQSAAGSPTIEGRYGANSIVVAMSAADGTSSSDYCVVYLSAFNQ